MSDLSQQKLNKLIEIEGCDYTTEMEPDQDRGWCEICNTNSMKSALVLAGII